MRIGGLFNEKFEKIIDLLIFEGFYPKNFWGGTVETMSETIISTIFELLMVNNAHGFASEKIFENVANKLCPTART